MTFINYSILFEIPAIIAWAVVVLVVLTGMKQKLVWYLSVTGILLYLGFIVLYWMDLQRPPMRTMGETHIWFAFFISLVGTITYRMMGYRYVYVCYMLMAIVFASLHLMRPEAESQNLMPALQSFWFIPHVTAYMLSYALLGSATITAIGMLIRNSDASKLHAMDTQMYTGFALLVAGMLMGAVWAKDAWGHYWSWDPKETWAFITALAYIIVIHLRLQTGYLRMALWMLILAFALLMFTWKGVGYLPSAQNSVHIYSR